MKTHLIFFVILFSLCLSDSAISHPHVFVDVELTVVFDDKGLTGFRQCWIFDEMFSSSILTDFDKDSDNILDVHEIEDMKKGAFDNLRNYEYFTHVLIDGRTFRVQYVTGFSAKVQGNRLIYTFFVPCHVTAVSQSKHIVVSLFDKTYYTDVALLTDLVSFEGESNFVVEYRIQKIREFSFYYGQVVPEGIFLTFRTKS